MIQRLTSLSQNIVQFCRYLRPHGFAISAEEEATALKSLEYIDYRSPQVFRLALKSVLCRSRPQTELFDELFTQYWKELTTALDSKPQPRTTPARQPVRSEDAFKALKTWLNGNKNPEVESTASYSVQPNLSRQDFSKVPADQLDELMQTVKALSRRLAAQTSRRYEKSAKARWPDLRKTLRKNMRHGGELIDIAFRQPKRNRLKLVVLCDVSKSMELYSAFLLQFMYSFGQVFRRIETFAFSTSLQRLTQQLQQNRFDQVLQILSARDTGWSGGTRIGESLHAFIEENARLLDKRTVVIMLSDGWDTGEISLLSQSMEQIHARSRKVIWLNPLAGYAAYRPEVAGMQAALPYVDVFAPVHNAESLRKLNKWL